MNGFSDHKRRHLQFCGASVLNHAEGGPKATHIYNRYAYDAGHMVQHRVPLVCRRPRLLLWRGHLDSVGRGTYEFADSVRYATFQVVSILTTTGFTTADYELWPGAAQMVLYAVCFIGACAGSTTSGIKIVHYVLIWKFIIAAVKKMFFQPLAVVSVRLDGLRVEQAIINLALCYFIVNMFLVVARGLFMSVVDGMDTTTAISSVIATLMNIGPGFGDVGPTENFAHISAAGKWFLSFNMLVGRLEMFSALVLLYPSFWQK